MSCGRVKHKNMRFKSHVLGTHVGLPPIESAVFGGIIAESASTPKYKAQTLLCGYRCRLLGRTMDQMSAPRMCLSDESEEQYGEY